ncbi:MAG TPA: hypothetical protein VEQ58_01170, partial [Polyangiaceae bacterium]|nr:hypothetical protein [Polyangiaceae bacterium]
ACASRPASPGKEAAAPSAKQVVVAEQPRVAAPAPSESQSPIEAPPGETEACEAACIAASEERSSATAYEMEEARRQCPQAPPAARAKCLADVEEQAAQLQYSEDGNQHACRTNCPGYLDQFR